MTTDDPVNRCVINEPKIMLSLWLGAPRTTYPQNARSEISSMAVNKFKWNQLFVVPKNKEASGPIFSALIMMMIKMYRGSKDIFEGTAFKKFI